MAQGYGLSAAARPPGGFTATRPLPLHRPPSIRVRGVCPAGRADLYQLCERRALFAGGAGGKFLPTAGGLREGPPLVWPRRLGTAGSTD